MDGKLKGFVSVMVYLYIINSTESRLTMRLQKNLNATRITSENTSFAYPYLGVYNTGYGNLMGSLNIHSGFVNGWVHYGVKAIISHPVSWVMVFLHYRHYFCYISIIKVVTFENSCIMKKSNRIIKHNIINGDGEPCYWTLFGNKLSCSEKSNGKIWNDCI